MQDHSQSDKPAKPAGHSQSDGNGATAGEVPSKWSRQAYEVSQKGDGGSKDDGGTNDAPAAADDSSPPESAVESATEARFDQAAEQPPPVATAVEETIAQRDLTQSAQEPAASSTPAAVPMTRGKKFLFAALLASIATTVIFCCYEFTPRPPQTDTDAGRAPQLTLAQKLVPLNKEIEAHPKGADTYYQRACVYYDCDQAANALADLNKAIELYPTFWQAYALRADVASYQNQNALALSDAKKVIKAVPKESGAWEKLATVENRMGQFDAAIVDAQHGYKLNDKDLLACGEIATAMAGMNKYSQAIDWLTRQETLCGPFPSERAIENRGLQKFHLRDFDGCIADENEAMRLVAHQGTELILRAYAEAAKGDIAQAEADTAQGLLEEKNPARGHRLAGDLYRMIGNFDKSIEEYGQAIALFPEGSTAYRNRGITYYQAGQLQNALADLQTACKNKAICASLSYLALVEEDLGQTANAGRDIKKAGLISTPISIFYSNRGAIMLKQGRLSAALADAQKAASMDKLNSDAYQLLGNIYMAQGKKDQGQQNFDQAKQLGYPGSSPAAGW